MHSCASARPERQNDGRAPKKTFAMRSLRIMQRLSLGMQPQHEPGRDYHGDKEENSIAAEDSLEWAP